ncbi:MAG: hypothetical protein AAB512_02855 [Patescibacteria group bacterium]
MAEANIGVVIHCFPKLFVAVIKLSKKNLKIGDRIKLVNKQGENFTQTVESMQIKHAQIDIARAGDEFGLKTTNAVKLKSPVIKIL